MHNVLAGNPGPATSPVTAVVVVMILVLAAGGAFGVAALRGPGWRRRQAGVRREALSGDVTATWPVEVQGEGYFTFHGPGMRGGRVSLRGGFIEVAHASPVARTLNGAELCFPARETRLSVESSLFGRERLVISGPSGGRAAVARVAPGSRVVLEQIWKALIAAGATYGQ
jgi:hypothetical protein